MTWFALRNVNAARWIRTPGPNPHEDNAADIIDFIGRDRILGEYHPQIGDEVILFRTDASTIGMGKVHPMDWIIRDAHNEPMAVPQQVLSSLISYEIKGDA